MALKALDVFQGSDWLTYRWSVAQMFDTLDRIRELCRHEPDGPDILPPDLGTGPLQYEMTDEGVIDAFRIIADLADDLSGEFDAVQADLIAMLQKDLSQRWMSFEINLHIKELRKTALEEHEAQESSGSAADTITALASRIRDLLKKLDQ